MKRTDKQKVIDYLRSGEVVAVAAGFPQDRRTGEYVMEEYFWYTDGIDDWTTEDIISFERYGEVFNASLIARIKRLSN